jgi:hypothetical protein
MTWLNVLIAVAVLVAVVALLGVRPKGGRPVERTQLMTAARVVLVILVAVVAWAMWVR